MNRSVKSHLDIGFGCEPDIISPFFYSRTQAKFSLTRTKPFRTPTRPRTCSFASPFILCRGRVGILAQQLYYHIQRETPIIRAGSFIRHFSRESLCRTEGFLIELR